MTLEQLQTAAKNAGIKFELNPRYTERTYYNCATGEFEKIQTGWYFGFNNLSGRDSLSWTWFESIGMKHDYYVFVERYSMRTGKADKGRRTRFSACERIAKLLGIDYADLY